MSHRRGVEPFSLRLLILSALILCGLLPLAKRSSPAIHAPVYGFRTQTVAMAASQASAGH